MLNQFGVWYLVGIVSAGYSCAKQYQPGIYHRVSESSTGDATRWLYRLLSLPLAFQILRESRRFDGGRLYKQPPIRPPDVGLGIPKIQFIDPMKGPKE